MQTIGKRHHGRAGKPKMGGNQYVSHGRRERKGRRNQRQKSARKHGSDYQETGVVKEWLGRIIRIIENKNHRFKNSNFKL